LSSAQAKRRGTEAEVWPVERAWVEKLDADRLRLSGREDEGDWWLRTRRGDLWVMQSKAVKRISLTSVLRQAQEQARNYAKHRHMEDVPLSGVLVRPYGYGRGRIDEWPVVQTFGQLLERG